MFVEKKTTVTFTLVTEYRAAQEFKEKNPDWTMEMDTQYIRFTKVDRSWGEVE